MSGVFKHRSVPPILAVSVVALLALALVLVSSGGSQGAATGTLADYMPRDAAAYLQTDLKPGAEAGKEVDRAVRRLAGIGLKPAIGDLFDSLAGGIDYRVEVEPWLSGPVALASGSSREEWGLAAEVGDAAAARDFEAGLRDDGDLPGGLRSGIVGDALVVAGSQRHFDRMAEAFEGESLADTDAFAKMPPQTEGEGVAQVFISNTALLDALDGHGARSGRDSAGRGFEARPLFESLGIEPEGTATVMSLSVEGDRISLAGESGLQPESSAGDASSLIGGFPAATVIAAGVSDVGEDAGELLEALEQADEGDLPPAGPDGKGAFGGILDRASGFGIDIPELIASLDTAGVFVTGDRPEKMRGAIVATSSDPALIEESLDRISSLAALAGGDFLRPLPGGLEGFSLVIPGMRAGKVAVGYRAGRLAIALGIPALRQALRPAGRTLADTAAFNRAAASLEVEAVNFFARPAPFAAIVNRKAAVPGDGPSFYQLRPGRLLAGIETVTGGVADGRFEVDLNLKAGK